MKFNAQGYFNNKNFSWFLKNVPLSNNLRHLLIETLKINVFEKSNKKKDWDYIKNHTWVF